LDFRCVTSDGQAISASLQGRQYIQRGQNQAGQTHCDPRKLLHKFLSKYPFASVKIIVNHFGLSPSTVTDLLSREPGLRTFSRRWVSHSLSARIVYARSRNQVIPCVRSSITASKGMITVLSIGRQLLLLNALLKRFKFN
jgi:hypothetical protein